MSLTDRDKKIALLLIPMVLLLGYWFMILSPQRSELSSLDERVMKAETARDTAVSNAQRLQQSKTNYAEDYTTVVKLGKATPSTLDMPSLLVQLETAANGTKIDFDSITVGDRTAATPAAAATGSGSSSSGAAPVESGGEKAQSSAGQNTEKANEAADTADDRNAATSGSAADGASTAGTGAGSTSPVAGLDTVPLTFTFEGSYFDLADFFHRVKRFVRVASSNIDVKGRLMTIDGMNLKSQEFPSITAQVTATVYLSPKSEGATGGGTPQGPAATPAAAPSSGATTPPAAPASTGAAE